MKKVLFFSLPLAYILYFNPLHAQDNIFQMWTEPASPTTCSPTTLVVVNELMVYNDTLLGVMTMFTGPGSYSTIEYSRPMIVLPAIRYDTIYLPLGTLPLGPHEAIASLSINGSVADVDTLGFTVISGFTAPGAVVQNPDCDAYSNGYIDLSPPPGSSGWTYMWSTGDTSQDLSILGNGTYSVTITDSSGCTWSDTFLLDAPAASPSYSAIMNPAPGGGVEVTFTNTSTGDPLGWNWQFGDGATSSLEHPVHIYDSSGWYIVCLTVNPTHVACEETRCDSLFVIATGTIEPQTVRFDVASAAGSSDLCVIAGVAGTVEVWSLSGMLLFSEQISSGKHSLLMKTGISPAPGVYLVRFSSGHKTVTKKWICAED